MPEHANKFGLETEGCFGQIKKHIADQSDKDVCWQLAFVEQRDHLRSIYLMSIAFWNRIFFINPSNASDKAVNFDDYLELLNMVVHLGLQNAIVASKDAREYMDENPGSLKVEYRYFATVLRNFLAASQSGPNVILIRNLTVHMSSNPVSHPFEETKFSEILEDFIGPQFSLQFDAVDFSQSALSFRDSHLHSLTFGKDCNLASLDLRGANISNLRIRNSSLAHIDCDGASFLNVGVEEQKAFSEETQLIKKGTTKAKFDDCVIVHSLRWQCSVTNLEFSFRNAEINQSLVIVKIAEKPSKGKVTINGERAVIGKDLEIGCVQKASETENLTQHFPIVQLDLNRIEVARRMIIGVSESQKSQNQDYLECAMRVGKLRLSSAELSTLHFDNVPRELFFSPEPSQTINPLDTFTLEHTHYDRLIVDLRLKEESEMPVRHFLEHWLGAARQKVETDKRRASRNNLKMHQTMARALKNAHNPQAADHIHILGNKLDLSYQEDELKHPCLKKTWLFLLILCLPVLVYFWFKIYRETGSFLLGFRAQETVSLSTITDGCDSVCRFLFQTYSETWILLVAVIVGAVIAVLNRSRLLLYLSYHTEWINSKLFRAGLRPLYSIGYLLVLSMIGAFIFSLAEAFGVMAPTSPEIYHLEHDFYYVDRMQGARKHGPSPAKPASGQSQPKAKQAIKGAAEPRNGLDYEHMRFMDDHRLLGFDEDFPSKRSKEWPYHQHKWLPMAAQYKACRLNWANPNQIEMEKWIDILFKGAQQSSYHRYKTEEARLMAKEQIKMIDRNDMCDAFLPAEHSKFSPVIYAFDICIPLLDLRQEEEWSPRAAHPETGQTNHWAYAVILIETLLILCGWFFAIVFAAAMTGLSDPTRRIH